jgi:hypothetical protein
MAVVKLSEYAKKEKTDAPLSITFFGPKFCKTDGTETSLNITIIVKNGNVLGLLSCVQEEGGIGQFHDNQYLYLPWPCACVVMHAPDDIPFEIGPDSEPESEDV